MADYSSLINAAAQKYNLDPALVHAVIDTESSDNPNAVSDKGAVGLGQLTAPTAKALGVTDRTDPAQNINGTAKLLDELLTKAGGNVPLALARYHGGYDTSQWGPRTQEYPGKVLSKLQGAGMAQKKQNLPGIPDFSGVSNEDIDAQFAAATGTKPTAGAKATAPAQSSGDTISDADFAKISGFNPAPSSKAPAAQPATQPAGTPAQPNTLAGYGENFLDAAFHNAGKFGVGAAQMALHGAAAAQREITGGTSLGDTSHNFDQWVNNAENKYQQQVPNNAASYAGAAVGQIAPMLGTGGAATITKGAELGRSLGALIGPRLSRLGAALGASAGSGVVGGTTAALNPVTGNGDYGQEKAGQIAAGTAIGAVAPGVTTGVAKTGNYLANLARGATAIATSKGQQKVAGQVLRDLTENGTLRNRSAEVVPGSSPTLAEVTQNPNIAALQRAVASTPEGAELANRQTANTEARNAFAEQLKGSPGQVDTMVAARDKAAEKALQNTFQNAQPVDTAPVVGTIDSILNGPGGDRTAVKTALTNIRNKLVKGTETIPPSATVDKNGNPLVPGSTRTVYEDNAERLYNSVRKEIGDMLDPKMATSDPKGIQAASELLKVRDALDDQIEQAAPGFAEYRKAYADASKPINALKYLQGLDLVDNTGNVSLNKVNTAIKNIQTAKTGPITSKNNGRDVTNQQLVTLKALREDLVRERTGLDAGKATVRGSTTAQNLNNMAGSVLGSTIYPGVVGQLLTKGGSSVLATGSLGALAGGLPGAIIGGALSHGLGKANASIKNRVINALLNPAEGQRLMALPAVTKQAPQIGRNAQASAAALLSNQSTKR